MSKLFCLDYVPNRGIDELHLVRKAALNASCTPRIAELAVEKVRESSDHIEFRDDAWTVSEAAKNANASSRIIELAVPKTHD